MITFGIITNGKQDTLLEKCIKSIQVQKIEESEILVVGNTAISFENVQVLPFDEDIVSSWITRKKNLIAEFAKNETIVLMHDYFELSGIWSPNELVDLLEGQWDVGMCKVKNADGSRYTDWCLWPYDHWPLRLFFLSLHDCLLPYTEKLLQNLMYASGSFFIVKRDFLRKNPLDESKSWGEGEDVEWSIRLRDKWKYEFFESLEVRSQKQKKLVFTEVHSIKLPLLRIYAFIYRALPLAIKRIAKTEIFPERIKKIFPLNFS